MYFTAQENQFRLFTDLLPVSIVAPLNIDDEELTMARMYQCKYLFDKAVHDRFQMNDGDVSVDGVKIGNIKY